LNNILEIEGLSKSYGGKAALANINITIPGGCIAGLLGPNGSGKTTLLKIITGLLSQDEGKVSINGDAPGYKANGDISYLPDKNHIPIWMEVNQAVSFFEDFYPNFERERAIKMITTLGIPLDKKIKNLSRGQQEKVQLSLVMSRNAKLYILDEPIGAVDPASRDFIIDTIIKNYQRESSILLSTHIISDVEPILDMAILLKEGEIFLMGEVDKIREEKQNSLDGLFREVFRNVV